MANNIALALQGFGAGVAGRGGQFIQGIEEQRRLEEEQRLQSEQQRHTAMIMDNRVVLDHLKKGRTGPALELLDNRINLLGQVPGADPSDSQGLRDTIASGNIDAAIQESTIFDDEAVTRGFIDPIGGDEDKFIKTTEGGQAIVRTQSGEFEARTIKGIAEMSGRKPEDVQKQINVLRKDITNAGKDFAKIEAAKNRITKTGRKGTAASDISLVFNFMKMNDPGSTVREGEFATAQNATGVDGRVVNLYNRLREGTRLSAPQREDFISQSEGLFDAQRDAFDSQIGNILQQADQDQIPRVRVFGEKRLKAFDKRESSRNAAPTGKTATNPQTGEKLQQMSDGTWSKI